jgi:Zn-dependent protease
MFGQIQPTPYDLRFEILGIPIRVHPIFWASSAWLAWAPGRLDIVLVRVLCIFLAILVHELGHALMTRRFGWQSEIVLYILGGYATSTRHSTGKDIAVSAAGPAAGFALYFLIRFLVPPLYGNLQELAPDQFGRDTRLYELANDAFGFSLFVNLAWNVVNLLPVLPLDGGQISREYWNWARPRNGMEICVKLSMISSGAVAAWSAFSVTNPEAEWTIGRLFGLDSLFLGLMFGYLCYLSYQELQNMRGRYW